MVYGLYPELLAVLTPEKITLPDELTLHTGYDTLIHLHDRPAKTSPDSYRAEVLTY